MLGQYLRCYCSFRQHDWSSLLPLAEFAYNNAEHSATHLSPFFANYGYNPRADSLDGTSSTPPTSTTLENSLIPAVDNLMERFSSISFFLQANLEQAQTQAVHYYDRRHRAVEYEVGQLVWLSSVNISSPRPSRKLDYKRLGPFAIQERIGPVAYRLQLPDSLNIHPVFHVSLLHPYTPPRIPGQSRPPPPPPLPREAGVQIEVQEILDSRFFRGNFQYLVSWSNLGPEDNSWELVFTIQHVQHLIDAFHARFPDKPRLAPRPRPTYLILFLPTTQFMTLRFWRVLKPGREGEKKGV